MFFKSAISSKTPKLSKEKSSAGLLIPESELIDKTASIFKALLCNIKIIDLMKTMFDIKIRANHPLSHLIDRGYLKANELKSDPSGGKFNLNEINTIKDVIYILEEIIHDCKKRNDPLGYFAVLYQKVTIKVKEGIQNNFFDNGSRMEQLDIIFAKRYLKAYFAFRANEPLTTSWKWAFELGSLCEPTVLQHLILGINAHINLDLGIAAAEVCKKGNLDDLKNDFIKINKILSSLVDDVQYSLTGIWPVWGLLQRRLGQLDNIIINIIIQGARKGAWSFAKRIFNQPQHAAIEMIRRRDRQTARIASIIGKPGRLFRSITKWIRALERGSVADKINELKIQTYYVPAYAKS